MAVSNATKNRRPTPTAREHREAVARLANLPRVEITPQERRAERCSIVLRWVALEDLLQDLLCDVESAVARKVMDDCGGARCFDITLEKALELLRSDRPTLTAADIAE